MDKIMIYIHNFVYWLTTNSKNSIKATNGDIVSTLTFSPYLTYGLQPKDTKTLCIAFGT